MRKCRNATQKIIDPEESDEEFNPYPNRKGKRKQKAKRKEAMGYRKRRVVEQERAVPAGKSVFDWILSWKNDIDYHT